MKDIRKNTRHSDVVRYVELKIRKFFAGKKIPGHGVEHAARVAHYAYEIARAENAPAALLCEVAGWLHDIGRVPEYLGNPLKKTHHELSFELLAKWFEQDKKFARYFMPREQKELLYSVLNHWDDTANTYKSAAILRDADKLDLLGVRGMARHFETHLYLDDVQRAIWFLINILRGERLHTKAARAIAHRDRLFEPYYKWISEHLPVNKKVLCALSGGVDSAVAAYILKRAGFEVIGAYMKNWSDSVRLKGTCKWQDERRDAARTAAHIGIPFITLDFEKEYKSAVVKYLFAEYKKGRTPNPDVLCNNAIKFPLLLRAARANGCAYIATGHYARIIHDKQSHIYTLQIPADRDKDQTYFLHRLAQIELAHALFPLNLITKHEVRVIARHARLPVADKEESMGICFIGEVQIKQFLQQKIKPKPGKIVDTDGRVVGMHDGLYWYTEGQRHGLNIGGGKPYFVARKDMKRNELIVARGEQSRALYSDKAYIEDVRWIGAMPRLPLACQVRLRHRQPLERATAILKKIDARKRRLANTKATHFLHFQEKQRAMAPGQFAVFYKGMQCLGGGVIVAASLQSK